MKYIRTNDGVYERFTKEISIKGYINVYAKSPLDTKGYRIVAEERVIKTADTIEELCDEFVYLMESGRHNCKEKHTDIIIMFNDKPVAYYGAIWTEWGLKYVAKMNKKGELELL